MSTEFTITGMTCAACVRRVEKAIAKLPEVAQVNVNLAAETAHIEWSSNASEQAQQAVIAAVDKAGYSAVMINNAQQQLQQQADQRQLSIARQKRNFYWALVFSLPVFILEMSGHLWPSLGTWLQHSLGSQRLLWLEFILTSLVMSWPGRQFYILGFKSLKNFSPDMNALVAIGSLSAYLFSVVVLLWPHLIPADSRHVYFESAAVVITLVLLGRLLEARSKGQASEAVSKLLGMQARIAHREGPQGYEDVSIEQLKVGDIVLVKPGETIPADGKIIEGSAYINQAMFTGESQLCPKHIEDAVIGGSISSNNSLRVLITQVGASTLLAQIVQMVQQAQAEKLPIQTILDRVTAYFVPAVLTIALITFALWCGLGPAPVISNALVATIAVLIVACPCAMGLAVPVSIMVASGRAAQLQILFRKSSALQLLCDTQALLFDKTGTLTYGQAQLQHSWHHPDYSAEQVLAMAAAIEQESEHPLAQALTRAAQTQQLDLPRASHFKNHSGLGISGQLDELTLYVGSAPFMSTLGLDLHEVAAEAKNWTQQGQTVIYTALKAPQQPSVILVAAFSIADQVRTEAKSVIAQLHRMGITTLMITGDNQQTANAIAKQLGITHVYADTLPADKAKIVQQIQQKYSVVAFTGDGVNDAPALATANIGIAIGSGTDIAIESADVVLMGSDLNHVPTAIDLAKATFKNIKENLFWAFFYNILLIPIAAGLFYPWWGLRLSPMFAAAAMAMSSVFVVLNALRLRRYQYKTQ